jgi:alkaline phosphatase
MRTNYWKRVLVLILVGAMTLVSTARAKPKNVIFFIADGMGFEHVEAASLFLGRDLCFESFTSQGQVRTYPADVTVIPDSASAGTALATGRKVFKEVVSVAIPGDESELETLLELYKSEGAGTGIVTTTYMTHATPATFGAHEDNRENENEIAVDYFAQDPLINVLFGGGGNGLDAAEIPEAYTIVTDNSSMSELDTELEGLLVSGQFGNTHLPYEYDGLGELPHLSEMTATALAILDNDQDGFFLMVEGGKIDLACHDNDLERMIGEMVEFDVAVQVAIDWAQANDPDMSETLILVVSDHETGGLDHDEITGEVEWLSKEHTDVDVPVYASGVNAGLIRDIMDNTFMFTVVTAVAEPAQATNPYPAEGVINLDIETDLTWRAGIDAVSHNVYFGTDVLQLVSTQTETVYEPGFLIPNTTYYWRIDEVCPDEVIEGDMWSFTTLPGALYVSDISMDYSEQDEWYAAQATVTIDIDLDSRLGTTIRDAMVCGNWYYNDNGNSAGNKIMMPVEGIVGPSGKVTLESPNTTAGGVFKFEVTDIVKTDLVYCPEFDIETSDSIMVP